MTKIWPASNNEYVLTDQDIIVTKTDLNGLITYVNDDVLRITGFSEQELIGSNHNIFRHPDMPAEVFSDLWCTILNKSTWRGIIKNKTKDGRFYWVRADVTPLYENDFLIGYISVRRKAANNDIKKAEDIYAQMKAGTFQGKLSYGEIQENFVFQTFKRKLNNLSIGTRLSILLCLNTFFVLLLVTVNFSNLNELNEDHLNNLSQIQSLSTEVNLAHARQHATNQQKTLSELSSSTLKKSKEEIKLSDYFYQAKTHSNQNLLNIQNESILIVLLSLIVLVILCELIIRSIVIPLKDATRTLMQISSGNYNVLVEHHSKSEIGQMIDALRSTSVRLGFEIANEKKTSSEIIKAHEKNHVLNAQISQLQRLESIGRMTSGIAHDFNNLLMAIAGYNELNKYSAEDVLLESKCRKELNEELLENTTQIQVASRKAASLIEKMLLYCRRDGENEVRHPVINLNEVLKENLKMLRSTIPNTIVFEIDLVEQTFDLSNLDETYLNQIIVNLFVNARDAMDGKGIITLKTNISKNISNVCSCCQTEVDGRFVEISVKDNGSGIEPDIVRRIFDPFYTTKPVGEGTGLGLSVIVGILHNLGGHIVLESEVGIGTTFRLFLPLVNAA